MKINCFVVKMVGCYTVNLFTYVLIMYFVNNKGKWTHKIPLKTTTASHLVFTWVSPEADPEINTKGVFHRKSWNISKGQGCEIGQKRKSRKGLWWSNLLLWKTGAYSHWGALGAHVNTHTHEQCHIKRTPIPIRYWFRAVPRRCSCSGIYGLLYVGSQKGLGGQRDPWKIKCW